MLRAEVGVAAEICVGVGGGDSGGDGDGGLEGPEGSVRRRRWDTIRIDSGGGGVSINCVSADSGRARRGSISRSCCSAAASTMAACMPSD